MPFDFDATGIEMDKPKGSFEKKLLSKGWYDLTIVSFNSKDGTVYPKEGYTKDGKFPKVDILVEVTNPPGEWVGSRLFHSVTFKPAQTDGKPTPGAGMSLHFLKTINQPYEGVLKGLDASEWVGESFRGYVIEEEFMGKKGNKIKQIEPIEKKTDDSLPF